MKLEFLFFQDLAIHANQKMNKMIKIVKQRHCHSLNLLKGNVEWDLFQFVKWRDLVHFELMRMFPMDDHG